VVNIKADDIPQWTETIPAQPTKVKASLKIPNIWLYGAGNIRITVLVEAKDDLQQGTTWYAKKPNNTNSKVLDYRFKDFQDCTTTQLVLDFKLFGEK
jgi:hypothetical protein